MIHYPLTFPVQARSEAGTQVTWSSVDSAGREAACAIPPEFEGPGGGYSPEDFYALAVLNCFIATFKVIAEKSKADYAAIEARGDLIVDRNEKGAPWMKAMVIHVRLEAGDGDRERLLRLLEKTSASCLVANSIRTEVRFEFEII